MMKRDYFNILLSLSILIVYSLEPVSGVCGYPSCPKAKPGYVNVHLVAHSHDDVGWLKTVDQYYHGTRREIDPSGVQYIFDSVVVELKKNPSRRFIVVEIAFFTRWWNRQNEETRKLVNFLVQSGQLEFISGGWCMNDEGSTHYSGIIDQMTLGMRFLNDTFGDCAVPKIAWQIDTFGHSREQAFIYAQMGFDAFFFGRMDYQYKSHLKAENSMEMIWSSNPANIGKAAWLFTGVLYNYYQPPNGFCFDQLCEDDPINDDPELDEYNVNEKVERFIRISRSWARAYNHSNILMTMGSDFHYMNANMWFKNLDKLIKYVNAYNYGNGTNSTLPKVNVMYSSPSCYLQEVHRSGKHLKIKTTDFFPYSNDPYGFWSGYFTSRPTFKYFISKANTFLQACKQLAVGLFEYGKLETSILDKVLQLKKAVAVSQHHDAITGTAKQHVTDDYSKRLAVGMESCEQVVDEAFRKLQLNGKSAVANISAEPGALQKFAFCQLTNISACAATENMTDFLVSIYNPVARSLLDTYVRIPVISRYWTVQGRNGLMASQIVEIPDVVIQIPGRTSTAKYELVVKVNEVPGFSVENVRVTATAAKSDAEGFNMPVQPEVENSLDKGADILLKNSLGLKLVVDRITGLLKYVSRGNVQLPLEQSFHYYLAMAGNNSRFDWRASGAYVLRPNTSAADDYQPVPVNISSYKIYEGTHVTEIHQVFNSWISQVVRLYDKSDLVEFEWLVGPIPVDDQYGKEVITRYTTNIPTNGTFFTDSNGRQLVKRNRNKRDYPFWEYERVAQNYYPVTSRILINKDGTSANSKSGPTLVVLTDRSQGGTSMKDGQVELMVHRRLLFDDAFGVGEPLNETAYGTGLVARGKHWLLLCGEGTGVPVSRHRTVGQDIFMEKVVAFSSVRKDTVSTAELLATRKSMLSQLSQVLPPNIHVLTLEALSPTQILLRLEHFYEKWEDSPSAPVKIPTRKLLRALPFVKVCRETALGGNQWIEEVKRFEWTPTKEHLETNGTTDELAKSVEGEIVLRPMEIKTFLCSA